MMRIVYIGMVALIIAMVAVNYLRTDRASDADGILIVEPTPSTITSPDSINFLLTDGSADGPDKVTPGPIPTATSLPTDTLGLIVVDTEFVGVDTAEEAEAALRLDTPNIFDRDYLIAQLDGLPLEMRYQIDKARYEAGKPQIWILYLKPYAYPEETTMSNRLDALLIEAGHGTEQ